MKILITILLLSVPVLAETPPKITRAELLAVTSLHAAGTFDAYTTHTSLCDPPPGYVGVEENPLLRPLAHSGAIYPAINFGDAVLDLWLLKSHRPWNHKLAWISTVSMIGLHIGLGIHGTIEHERAWNTYANGLQPSQAVTGTRPPIHR